MSREEEEEGSRSAGFRKESRKEAFLFFLFFFPFLKIHYHREDFQML